MRAESESDSAALRTALRDLAALSTIPAAWAGRDAHTIAAGLADVLVESLELDFAFVRLSDPRGGRAIDVMRGYAWNGFTEWLQSHNDVGRFSSKEIMAGLGSEEAGHVVVSP